MKILTITLILLSCLVTSKGQGITNSSVFIQTGVSFAENVETDGLGFSFGVGYQGNLWRDRLRYVPSFTFGKYNNYGRMMRRMLILIVSILKTN